MVFQYTAMFILIQYFFHLSFSIIFVYFYIKSYQTISFSSVMKNHFGFCNFFLKEQEDFKAFTDSKEDKIMDEYSICNFFLKLNI